MGRMREIRRLHDFMVWADDAVWTALRRAPRLHAAWREYAHVLGAEETWLARLVGRPPVVPVWPDPESTSLEDLRAALANGYGAYLDGLDEEGLDEAVGYTNSAGKAFETRAGDILQHVALHGQYHRGKVNLIPAARGRSLVRLVGSATAPDPRRHDEGIAVSYVEARQRRRWGCAAPTRRARGDCGIVLRHSSSPMSPHRIRRSSLYDTRKTLARGAPDFYHGPPRNGGSEPAPVDFIGWVRGAPAAVTPPRS